MMSKQQRFGLTEDSLKEAFRIFDKDDDGFLAVEELRHIMQSLGMVGIRELEKNHLKPIEYTLQCLSFAPLCISNTLSMLPAISFFPPELTQAYDRI